MIIYHSFELKQYNLMLPAARKRTKEERERKKDGDRNSVARESADDFTDELQPRKRELISEISSSSYVLGSKCLQWKPADSC